MRTVGGEVTISFGCGDEQISCKALDDLYVERRILDEQSARKLTNLGPHQSLRMNDGGDVWEEFGERGKQC